MTKVYTPVIHITWIQTQPLKQIHHYYNSSSIYLDKSNIVVSLYTETKQMSICAAKIAIMMCKMINVIAVTVHLWIHPNKHVIYKSVHYMNVEIT